MLAALLRADLVVLTKNKMRMLLSLLLPLIILSTTKFVQGHPELRRSSFIVGLAITAGIAGTSIMGYAPMVARDRDNGVFQRLRVSPAPTWVVMASRLSVQMVSNFAIALVVLILGDNIHHLSLSFETYVLVLVGLHPRLSRVSVRGPGAGGPGEVGRHRPGLRPSPLHRARHARPLRRLR